MSLPNAIRRYRDHLLLLVITLAAWWPLSLNLLSLKNDALVQYLAYRYHLSESIQNGFLPFWSPYLYTGFPIHADMQGETWNPIVIVLSLLTRYNMSVLQWEVLIYLYVAALGMYRLVRHFGALPLTGIVAAAAFVSCGYMTDSVSVVPWIPSAAFMPFIILYFLKLLDSPSLVNAVKYSAAVILQFLCGYPSFFIFLSYLLLIGFTCWAVARWRKGEKKVILHAAGFLAVAYGLFALICSPALVSYYEFLPYYSRGSGLGWEKGQSNPFPPQHTWSFILANAFSKVDRWMTDISMRNGYFGMFLFLFLLGLRSIKGFRMQVLALTLFCFLFSMGAFTPVQKFCFDHVPLMNTFRHPGTIRVFTTIGILLLASFTLDEFFRGAAKRWLPAYAGMTGFLLLMIIILNLGKVSFGSLIPPQFSPAGLKGWLDALDMNSMFFVVELLQLVFIGLFLFSWWKRKGPKVFAVLFIMNSLLFGWIGLPFTSVSKERTSSVNGYLASFPDGYPLPDPKASVEAEVISDSIIISPYGYHNFYNKKITIQDEIITPTLNKDYEDFLNRFHLRRAFRGAPFVFIGQPDARETGIMFPIDSSLFEIKVTSFTPNAFAFGVNKQGNGIFFIFQQYNHNWNAFVNGKPVEIRKANMAFMSVDVPEGHSVVEFRYRPQKVIAAMIVSGITILALLCYFVLRKRKPRA
jgi:hypothetical protein